MSMRKLVVAGKDFEWVAGRSHVRIRGNGHVVDLSHMKFLEEMGVSRERAYDMTENGSYGIEPSDVVKYITDKGWS